LSRTCRSWRSMMLLASSLVSGCRESAPHDGERLESAPHDTDTRVWPGQGDVARVPFATLNVARAPLTAATGQHPAPPPTEFGQQHRSTSPSAPRDNGRAADRRSTGDASPHPLRGPAPGPFYPPALTKPHVARGCGQLFRRVRAKGTFMWRPRTRTLQRQDRGPNVRREAAEPDGPSKQGASGRATIAALLGDAVS
jgi:hypothetical protein